MLFKKVLKKQTLFNVEEGLFFYEIFFNEATNV
jgi:hypothetical protein